METYLNGTRRFRRTGGRSLALTMLASAAWLAGLASAGELQSRVQTDLGSVEGARTSDGVLTFRGIPYAAPPIGELRWRAPQPAAKWDGVRPVRDFSADCIQQRVGPPQAGRAHDREQSEDCLALNVWTAARTPDERRPVMVWIHGGGFSFGSGASPELDGRQFARAGLVLVTFNYRLGVFGFLVHPDLTAESTHHSSGNYGILDQIAALQWVQRNITAFGGDPTRVTVFGESAGSTAINILQASPLAKGLFQRAIGESTSQMDAAAGLLGRQSLQQAEQHGREYGASVGASSIPELRALPAQALLKPSSAFWPQDPDGYVLPEEVYTTFAQGHQNDVPTLVGWNASEGINLRVPWIRPESSDEKAAFSQLYSRPDDEHVYTDTVAWQMRSWAGLQAEKGQHPSFVYLFEHHPPASDHAPPEPVHGAEIVYVFQSFEQMPRAWTSADRRVGRLMSQYWINFARSGDPNGKSLPQWPAYRTDSHQVMTLSAQPHAAPAPRDAEFHFIDDYFKRRRDSGGDR
jgi:para-nitrobenzyl esterase